MQKPLYIFAAIVTFIIALSGMIWLGISHSNADEQPAVFYGTVLGLAVLPAVFVAEKIIRKAESIKPLPIKLSVEVLLIAVFGFIFFSMPEWMRVPYYKLGEVIIDSIKSFPNIKFYGLRMLCLGILIGTALNLDAVLFRICVVRAKNPPEDEYPKINV